jgi:C4-dicarboxylate transporter DctM subunit
VAIGRVTPPVAARLPVAANLAQISLERVSRARVPFVLAMAGALAIIISWRALSTWLPRAFGLG